MLFGAVEDIRMNAVVPICQRNGRACNSQGLKFELVVATLQACKLTPEKAEYRKYWIKRDSTPHQVRAWSQARTTFRFSSAAFRTFRSSISQTSRPSSSRKSVRLLRVSETCLTDGVSVIEAHLESLTVSMLHLSGLRLNVQYL